MSSYYNERDRSLDRDIAAWEKHGLVVKDLQVNGKRLLEKIGVLLQAFKTAKIISATGDAGEKILRAGLEKRIQ